MQNKLILLWTPYFGSCAFHVMASSIFILKMIYYYILKNDLGSSFIFVLFLKGKQNKKKKNPKCDSLFGKGDM